MVHASKQRNAAQSKRKGKDKACLERKHRRSGIIIAKDIVLTTAKRNVKRQEIKSK
jgi:hypothetical protein